MTLEQITQWAREAGAGEEYGVDFAMNDDELQAFAAKVAAHEREECAKVCEARAAWIGAEEARDCAAAIRARRN